MAAENSTFSESWYRIATNHFALRPHVLVRRQFFRGERYYVLHDPFNNQFFRLRPAAYEFVARLRLERTVESIWNEHLTANPEDAPGQDQVLKLLGQLHASNLLLSDLPPDSAKVFERYEKKQKRETKGKLLNVMYARFPLWDPDALLKRLLPALRRIISPLGALLWLVVIGAGLKVVADHASDLALQTHDILSPSNLLLLYGATLLAKVVHEFGHACACRRFGGEVHVVGVMMMIFTPLPYVDTTSSWAFRSRWQRAFVGVAGMVAELFLAALAAFVWAKTGDGLLHGLAYNVMFVASVSTVLFNINPLLRFDGYYILSDLLEIPNLQTRSTKQLTHLVERYAFGIVKSQSMANSRREALWLAFYGVASKVYRLFVTWAILLFIAGQFLLLGVLLAAVGVVTWLLAPIFQLVRYLAASPRLGRQRRRAVLVSAGVVGGLLGLLFFAPTANHFRAPGILEAAEHTTVSTQTSGLLVELLAEAGSDVVKDQPLLRMENSELDWQLIAVKAQLAESRAMRERALQESAADLEPIDSRMAAVEQQLARLQEELASLIVRAPHAGRWIAPELASYRGTSLPRGMELGMLVNPQSYRFSAVVSQEDTSRLFDAKTHRAEVRLHGQAGTPLVVTEQQIIPAEQRRLPSAALGWLAGGEVAVTQDESGVKARETFFEVRATVQTTSGVVPMHGLSGAIRFELSSEPLGRQWLRKLHQLLQKRFGV